MRLDKFLKVSRLIKNEKDPPTEQQNIKKHPQNQCRQHIPPDLPIILINGRTAKASAAVKAGDVIEIQFGTKAVKVEVLDVQETVKKDNAAELYKYL